MELNCPSNTRSLEISFVEENRFQFSVDLNISSRSIYRCIFFGLFFCCVLLGIVLAIHLISTASESEADTVPSVTTAFSTPFSSADTSQQSEEISTSVSSVFSTIISSAGTSQLTEDSSSTQVAAADVDGIRNPI